MKKLPLSVTIITLNEEANISRCIGSLEFAREILVVDSGSTDRTCQLAEAFGARVIKEKWRGFGAQKAFAAAHATYDWILSIDADEIVPPELAAEIAEKFLDLEVTTAYRFPRKSFYLGRWIRWGGWYPDLQTKFFHRRHSRWDEAPIHEKVISPSQADFRAPLEHFVFKNIAHQVATNNRYSGLQAEALRDQEKKFSFFKLLVKPPVKFFENYIWKKGFLDGLPGFIIAVGSGYSVFLKWAKVWELEKDGR